jgi:anti-sigma regulatory factor (Ser/Thr protein kinase)
MASAATQANPRLITLVLPSIPGSVPVARLHVRAALGLRRLNEYADDAGIITSELVTNAVQHVGDNGTKTIGVTITYAESPAAVTIAVSDSCPHGPIRRDTSPGSEQGRGLQIIEALSVRWGWRREGGGKVIFAVLAQEA